MRKFVPILLCAAFAATFGASVPARADDATLLGTGIGGAVGGLLGNQIGRGAGQVAATGLGVITGGVIGNDVSRAVEADSASRAGSGSAVYIQPAPVMYNTYAPNYVAPSAPPPIYLDQSFGTYCRPYSQETDIAGRWQESYGTVCLQPDGTWRIVR